MEKPNLKITLKDRKRIFKRAHYLVKGGHYKAPYLTLSEALKICYNEVKAYKAKKMFEYEQWINKCILDIRTEYDVSPTADYQLELAYNLGANII